MRTRGLSRKMLQSKGNNHAPHQSNLLNSICNFTSPSINWSIITTNTWFSYIFPNYPIVGYLRNLIPPISKLCTRGHGDCLGRCCRVKETIMHHINPTCCIPFVTLHPSPRIDLLLQQTRDFPTSQLCTYCQRGCLGRCCKGKETIMHINPSCCFPYNLTSLSMNWFIISTKVLILPYQHFEHHQKQHHVPYSLAILLNRTFLLIHPVVSMRLAFQCVY